MNERGESRKELDARMLRVRATIAPARHRILEALKLESDSSLSTSELRRLSKRAARGSLVRNLEILRDAGIVEADRPDSEQISGATVWRLVEPDRPLTEWRESDVTDHRTRASVSQLRRMVTNLRFDRIRAWEERKAAATPGVRAPRLDLEINSDGLLKLTKDEVQELESELNAAARRVSVKARARRHSGDGEARPEYTIFLTMLGFPIDFEGGQ